MLLYEWGAPAFRMTIQKDLVNSKGLCLYNETDTMEKELFISKIKWIGYSRTLSKVSSLLWRTILFVGMIYLQGNW